MNKMIATLSMLLVIAAVIAYSLNEQSTETLEDGTVVVKEKENPLEKAQSVETTVHDATKRRMEQAE
ncbi:MAG: hypothetical protein AAGI11_19600 [Pseudomonadota bacterium]